MDKFSRIWKRKISAMIFCIAIAIAFIVFPHTHPADLLALRSQAFATIVQQMPYFGMVLLLAAWIFWFEAFSAAFHGARALDSIDKKKPQSIQKIQKKLTKFDHKRRNTYGNSN